jgi:hypothetical protein
MATRKASDSNLTGKKYNDASAGAIKVPDVPNTPSTPTTAAADAPSVAFTAASTGGLASNYVVSTGAGNLTWTGSSSPISAIGIAPGTAVTFKVKAVNSTGESSFSGESATVSVTGWGLAATLNSTQNWTVPTGVTKIGVAVISGGVTGNAGGWNGNNAGNGGRSGSGVSFWDFATNAGTTYLATVGGTGGDSSFGSLATAGANANSNVVTNRQLVNAANGGGGNTINVSSYQYNAVNGGANSASLVLNAPVNGPFTILHGGGGGGAKFENAPGSGPGGASFGGAGESNAGTNANRSAVGQAGTGPGGGGGAGVNAGGGAGAPGRILVFTFTA